MPRIELTCEFCHSPFRVKPSELAREPRFCSVPCRKAGMAPPLVPCAVCGTPFPLFKNAQEHGRKCCSRACGTLLRRHAETKEYACLTCGKSFFRSLAQQETNGEGKYCSKECRYSGDLASYFWQHVSPGEKSACWVWTGPCFKRMGYGRIRSIQTEENLAHRVSWLVHHGAIPEGLQVLHRCDNPPCVNPGHLFLGTHQENMADRNAKGRQARGEHAGNGWISDIQVQQIRTAYATGTMTIAGLARAFQISESQTRRIVRHESRVVMEA
jgi:hypothetical protein